MSFHSANGGGRYSPDGSKIVFSKGVQSPSGYHHSDIFVMNADGSNPTNLTSGDTAQDSHPAFSPDGSEIVWARNGDIWVMDSDGGNPPHTQLTTTADNGEPSYSPSGAMIVFTKFAESSSRIYKMNSDGTGISALTEGPGDQSPAFSPDGSKVVFTGLELNDQLLMQFRPELRYDTLETYRADAADTITDNYVNQNGQTVRSNYLNDDDGDHIAASDPALPEDQLSLGFLAPEYTHPWTCCPPAGGDYFGDASDTDRVDAANDYEVDAQRMHGDETYADKTYARAVPDTVTGGWTLQYWLFYYNNPKTWPVGAPAGWGAHEGDWEMVQVQLDADLEPTHASYAQHGWGEKCEWDSVERHLDHPVVYVAEGSHASYFTAGFHQNPNPEKPWELSSDSADGEGDVAVPSVVDVGGAAPGWLLWPGRWGGSTGAGDSPLGPAFQGMKWDDPAAWAEGTKDCTRRPGRSQGRPCRSPKVVAAPEVADYGPTAAGCVSTAGRAPGCRPLWPALST